MQGALGVSRAAAGDQARGQPPSSSVPRVVCCCQGGLPMTPFLSMGESSEDAKAPSRRTNSRLRRRPFPGTGFASPLAELPNEPLPSEATIQERRPRPDAPIMLLPVGQVDLSTMELVRRPLEEVYQRRTEIGASLPVPKYAHNPTRDQYHSSAILKRVETTWVADWDAAVGITEADLFVPEVPFIFGEADRSTRSALISLRRLRPEAGPRETRRDILNRRFLSEIIHQIGLIRGLAHCPNNRCVMFLASAVNEIDKRGSSLCANCRKRLQAMT